MFKKSQLFQPLVKLGSLITHSTCTEAKIDVGGLGTNPTSAARRLSRFLFSTPLPVLFSKEGMKTNHQSKVC